MVGATLAIDNNEKTVLFYYPWGGGLTAPPKHDRHRQREQCRQKGGSNIAVFNPSAIDTCTCTVLYYTAVRHYKNETQDHT